MITQRPGTSPRIVVETWLREIMRRAEGEKAERTLEKIVELSEPILRMTASSEAADPEKMRALVQRPDWPERAHKYLVHNAPLLTGIPGASRGAPSESLSADAVARSILGQIPVTAGIVTDGSAQTLSSLAEQVAVDLRSTGWREGRDDLWDGDGAAVLVREILGLPGDHERCLDVTDPQILSNALHGLSGLGVYVAPDAYPPLPDRDTEASDPET